MIRDGEGALWDPMTAVSLKFLLNCFQNEHYSITFFMLSLFLSLVQKEPGMSSPLKKSIGQPFKQQ